MSKVCQGCVKGRWGLLQTCQPKSAGTLCRAAFTECDLPEFCSGDSQLCPEDVTKKDGAPCNKGQVRSDTLSCVVCIAAGSYCINYSGSLKHRSVIVFVMIITKKITPNCNETVRQMRI